MDNKNVSACPRCGNATFETIIKQHDDEQMYSLRCIVCKLSGLETHNLDLVIDRWNRYVIFFQERHIDAEFDPVLKSVVDLAFEHRETWRDKPEDYWLARLMQEVGEAASSLVGDHDDPVEWELTQIAAICINWLEMRRERNNGQRST